MWNFQVTEHQLIEHPWLPTMSHQFQHSAAHTGQWNTSSRLHQSQDCVYNAPIWSVSYFHLITYSGSEKRCEQRHSEDFQNGQFFRELQAWAEGPKEGSQRDTVVEYSSNDCLMRWEKQDKKDQNGLNKSLGISICDSLAISIVTLHYFLLLSCLRPIEMRAAHLRQFVEITSSLWVMLMISDLGWSAVRWMADEQQITASTFMENFIWALPWILNISHHILLYTLLTFITLLQSILIFYFLNAEMKKWGGNWPAEVTQACPGFQDWFRQRFSLALLELQTNLMGGWSLRMCLDLCYSLPSWHQHCKTLMSWQNS